MIFKFFKLIDLKHAMCKKAYLLANDWRNYKIRVNKLLDNSQRLCEITKSPAKSHHFSLTFRPFIAPNNDL